MKTARFYQRDGLCLFTPVAPLVTGYVMIAPVEHRQTPLMQHPNHSLKRMIRDTLDALALTFENVWFFEHASRNRDGTSCVPHSHLHLLPGVPPLELVQGSVQESAPSQVDIYIGTREATLGLSVPARSRQHVRRAIAQAEFGLPLWDWRLHHHEPIYRATEAILPRLAHHIGGFSLLTASQ